tara:strand:- start:36 stop:542 length:507 start_codon:yes stop_codon:yes gene_type:complete
MDWDEIYNLIDKNLMIITNDGGCYREVCSGVKREGWDRTCKLGLTQTLHDIAGIRNPTNKDYRYYFTIALYDHYNEEFNICGKGNTPQPSTNNKVNDMPQAKPFEIKQLVLGKDVSTMTNEDFVRAISEVEGRIKQLSVVGVTSTKLTVAIASLKDDLERIVKAYDKA